MRKQNEAIISEGVFDDQGNMIGQVDQFGREVPMLGGPKSREELDQMSREGDERRAQRQDVQEDRRKKEDKERQAEELRMVKVKQAALQQLIPSGAQSDADRHTALEYVTDSGASLTREEAAIVVSVWERAGYTPDTTKLSSDAEKAYRYIKARANPLKREDGFVVSPEHRQVLDKRAAQDRRRDAVVRMRVASQAEPETAKPARRGFLARLFGRK